MENPSRPVTGYPAPNQNGHPYPPPPPSQPYQYYPQYYGTVPPPHQRRVTFFRSLLIATVAFTIIFGCIILIFWLVVRPRLPEFQLSSLAVSNFNASQSQLSATWDARFIAYNPNKKMIVSYYDMVSYVFFKSDYLTRTQIAPFKQGTRNETKLHAEFSIIDSYVDGKLVNDINEQRQRGSVAFNVKMEAIGGFKYGWWRTRRRLIRVWCSNAPVNISNNGTGNMVGGARKCEVG